MYLSPLTLHHFSIDEIENELEEIMLCHLLSGGMRMVMWQEVLREGALCFAHPAPIHLGQLFLSTRMWLLLWTGTKVN